MLNIWVKKYRASGREVEWLKKIYSYYGKKKIFRSRWDGNNPGNKIMAEEVEAAVRNVLKSHGFLSLSNKRILDIGCGSGKRLFSLLKLGATVTSLYGTDLLEERISEAKEQYPDLQFQCGNAENLNFPDNTFDLVLLFTVFSSILDKDMRYNISCEVKRVLKTGGAILWYDFRYNNPWNPNVKGIGLNNIKKLFPDFEIHLRTITLLPGLARKLGLFTGFSYPLLSKIPFLRTHCIGLFIKRVL